MRKHLSFLLLVVLFLSMTQSSCIKKLWKKKPVEPKEVVLEVYGNVESTDPDKIVVRTQGGSSETFILGPASIKGGDYTPGDFIHVYYNQRDEGKVITMVVEKIGPVAKDLGRFEVTPFIGYTVSDGVQTVPTLISSGTVIDSIGPSSGLSYGFQFDVRATDNMSFGFIYSDQDSSLKGTGTDGSENVFTDMRVRNYHGVFTYNLGDITNTTRPFFFGGAGATQYAPGDIGGAPVDGTFRFSTTWGGGLKMYPTKRLGLRLMGRWTPTYIKSSADGIWCGLYYCWVLSESHYSNQFEFSVGAAFRF